MPADPVTRYKAIDGYVRAFTVTPRKDGSYKLADADRQFFGFRTFVYGLHETRSAALLDAVDAYERELPRKREQLARMEAAYARLIAEVL